MSLKLLIAAALFNFFSLLACNFGTGGQTNNNNGERRKDSNNENEWYGTYQSLELPLIKKLLLERKYKIKIKNNEILLHLMKDSVCLLSAKCNPAKVYFSSYWHMLNDSFVMRLSDYSRLPDNVKRSVKLKSFYAPEEKLFFYPMIDIDSSGKSKEVEYVIPISMLKKEHNFTFFYDSIIQKGYPKKSQFQIGSD
jgi:hypothetical protein